MPFYEGFMPGVFVHAYGFTAPCEKHSHIPHTQTYSTCQMREQFATCPGTLLRSDLLLSSFLVPLTYILFSLSLQSVCMPPAHLTFVALPSLLWKKEGRASLLTITPALSRWGIAVTPYNCLELWQSKMTVKLQSLRNDLQFISGCICMSVFRRGTF